jgi:hypothetical protein
MNDGLGEEGTKFMNFYHPMTKDGYITTEIQSREEG